MVLRDVKPTVHRGMSCNGATAAPNTNTEYFLKGTITVSAAPFDALIRVYRKDTGTLLAAGRSSLPLGEFTVSWMGFSGQVFWIAFDDRGSPVLNAKIFDLVYGV